eukprot:TRINITY_DN7890_c0_g1_i1.p3 TRINITY_DN7890_c0_g1~~TRINITY_DN7890_c0_g1_i1.p3  ORF type:complete len:100 (-),score=18.03 TRINITY_DN7890_c0_g1_i1:716-1015(-)
MPQNPCRSIAREIHIFSPSRADGPTYVFFCFQKCCSILGAQQAVFLDVPAEQDTGLPLTNPKCFYGQFFSVQGTFPLTLQDPLSVRQFQQDKHEDSCRS